MKKCLLLITIIFSFYIFVSNSIVRSLTIPKDAIRIRIIPNSNSEFDQNMKNKIKEKLELKMYELLKEANNSKEAKQTIKNNLNIVDSEVKETLDKNNYHLNYKINYGKNYFPEKRYKGIKYKEGYYESLLVTLGKGEGDNWWCVLYPPLCLIEGEENTEVEYKSIVNEIIKKYS